MEVNQTFEVRFRSELGLSARDEVVIDQVAPTDRVDNDDDSASQ